MSKNIVKAIPAENFDTATLTANFQLVTTLPEACFYLKIVNTSTNVVVVSYDGATPHDVAIGDFGYELNAQTNAPFAYKVGLFPKGTQIWVRSETTAAGDLFVVGYYNPS